MLIHLVDGDRHRLVAKHGRLAHVQRLGDTHAIRRDTPLGLGGARSTTRPCSRHSHAVRTRFAAWRSSARAVRRIRTILVMPLLEAGTAAARWSSAERVVQPFTAKQIALLQTFADQAVIAIENVRLFRELQERTDGLGRSVEQLRALSEVGQAVSSTLDLDAVPQAIVARAAAAWRAPGRLHLGDDEPAEVFRLRATNILDPQIAEILGALGHPQGRGRDRAGRAHQGPGPDPRRQRGRRLRGTAPGRAPSRRRPAPS